MGLKSLPQNITDGPTEFEDVKRSSGTQTTPLQSQDSSHLQANNQIDGPRLIELMQRLPRLAALQEEAVTAQVLSRQRRRALGFRRNDVWMCDAAFMTELQKAIAQGKLKGFEELFRLGNDCQTARDKLGPLEEESILADQRWESQTFRLKTAEDSVYEYFRSEFENANNYPSEMSNEQSSTSEFSPEHESQVLDSESNDSQIDITYHLVDSVADVSSIPPLTLSPRPTIAVSEPGTPQDSMLLGMTETSHIPNTITLSSLELDSHEYDSDSGISAGLDRVLGSSVNENWVGSPQSFTQKPHDSLELYPALLTDFTTSRERVNNWLLQTALLSRQDAIILKNKLELEHLETPSAWAQLVIAWWEHDGAAIPRIRKAAPTDSEVREDGNDDGNDLKSPKTKTNNQTNSHSRPHRNATAGYQAMSPSNLPPEAFMIPLRPPPTPPQRRGSSEIGDSGLRQPP